MKRDTSRVLSLLGLKWRYWLVAARPKTLVLSLMPIVVGVCLAAGHGFPILWDIAFSTLCVALVIQIGTNYINDALDFQRGADTATRIGPMRVTQAGLLPLQMVHGMGIAMLASSFVVGFPLILKAGWPISTFIGVSALCGYLYTGGPAPLAYVGLAEIFSFLFFGVFSTAAAYILQTEQWQLLPFLAGCQVGCFPALLLALNNLRDYYQDMEANKRTLVVRFGISAGRCLITFLSLFPFIMGIFWLYTGKPFAALLPLMTLPLAIWIVVQVWQTLPSRAYNSFFGKAALFNVLFNALLAMGLWNR